MSKEIILSGFRIVNGFGWGVGSAVINGALEAIYSRPDKYSTDQLIIRPFPQFESGSKKLGELWEDYRQKMIALAGVSIIMFGNKKDSAGNLIPANGVKREFEIALENNVLPIPIGATGYIAKEISDIIIQSPNKYYAGIEWIIPIIQELSKPNLSEEEIINKLITIIQTLNK